MIIIKYSNKFHNFLFDNLIKFLFYLFLINRYFLTKLFILFIIFFQNILFVYYYIKENMFQILRYSMIKKKIRKYFGKKSR